MKKEGVIILIFLFLIFSILLVSASELDQVKKAYTCLDDKVNEDGCASLSLEEQIFVLLATGNCSEEVSLASKSSGKYMWWTKNNEANIKLTSLAVLALKDKINITNATNWLLSKTKSPENIEWFLEIESSEATICTLNDSLSLKLNTISIAEDKTISGTSGHFLPITLDKYWLGIDERIYGGKIITSCNEPFLTTLLFKKENSPTIYVYGESENTMSEGETTEIVDALCFTDKDGKCDYEGSLWASLVLYYLGYDEEIEKTLPYLIAMKNENSEFFPESFLHYLTGEFETEIVKKFNTYYNYWKISGNQYYDTALALLPFPDKNSLDEGVSAKQWLLEVQDENSGCWHNNNIRDTAFILFSMWDSRPVCLSVNDCGFPPACQSYSCVNFKCQLDYTASCGINGDGCCPTDGSCSPEEDSDCFECSIKLDCDDYISKEITFCKGNQVWRNVTDYKCVEKKCVEDKDSSFVRNCPIGQICYPNSGSCLSNKDLPDECTYDSDCDSGEICKNGYCVAKPPLDCKGEGYYCMSLSQCEGNPLPEYTCLGIFSCCDTAKSLNTCDYEGGEICEGDEECVYGYEIEVSDNLNSGEVCCIDGTCEEEEEIIYTCEERDGTCRDSCNKKEIVNYNYECASSGEKCCISKDKPKYILVWILLILIVLSLVGILFRDKLKVYYLKAKSKIEEMFGKGGKNKKTPPFGRLPGMISPPPQRALQRRIISSGPQHPPIRRPSPPQQSPPARRKLEEKPKNELDDVLKKLKEIGK